MTSSIETRCILKNLQEHKFDLIIQIWTYLQKDTTCFNDILIQTLTAMARDVWFERI